MLLHVVSSLEDSMKYFSMLKGSYRGSQGLFKKCISSLPWKNKSKRRSKSIIVSQKYLHSQHRFHVRPCPTWLIWSKSLRWSLCLPLILSSFACLRYIFLKISLDLNDLMCGKGLGKLAKRKRCNILCHYSLFLESVQF